jgi:hypothetical protein
MNFFANYPAPSVSSGGNASVGPNGAAAPIDSTEIGFIDGSGNLQGVSAANPLPVTIESEVGTLNVNVSQYGGVATTLGQKVSASSAPVVIASDQSAIPASQSGTWNINNVSGTISLPTGASTSALQTTGNSTLSSILANQTNGTQIVHTVPQINTNGSVSNSITVTNTSATTFSPPANAVGFVVESESSNTVNLRYACGTTATNSVGMLLEPGRDSGYIPSSGTVTIICATAASNQAASIQWVLTS